MFLAVLSKYVSIAATICQLRPAVYGETFE
jgi:hypothetical protein